MDPWIEFARGPLFRVALTVMLLGLGYRVAVAVLQIVGAWRRAADRRLPGRDIATATLAWLVPVRLLRSRPLYSIASLLFHVGILLLPFFLAGHVALLGGLAPPAWPTLSAAAADTLALVCLAALVVLLLGRVAVTSARKLTRLVLVLVPTTKIAHCALYPFTQLLFQLGWHFPADTGRHVAIALGKENQPI